MDGGLVTLKSTPPRCFGFALGFFDEEDAAAPPFGLPMAQIPAVVAAAAAGVLGVLRATVRCKG